VIQGTKKETMDEIYDFEKSNGITLFARGGLIPIKRKNNLYCNVLNYSRQLTAENILHAFGIVGLNQIKCYGRCAQIDSFDSTIVRALTAELYWIDTNLIKHRFNDQVIKNCDCIYCRYLTELNVSKYDFASEAIMQNLYLHNIITIYEQCKKMKNFRN
jgi:queuine/archaeosine tRNA-ribosyltransferase